MYKAAFKKDVINFGGMGKLGGKNRGKIIKERREYRGDGKWVKEWEWVKNYGKIIRHCQKFKVLLYFQNLIKLPFEFPIGSRVLYQQLIGKLKIKQDFGKFSAL